MRTVAWPPGPLVSTLVHFTMSVCLSSSEVYCLIPLPPSFIHLELSSKHSKKGSSPRVDSFIIAHYWCTPSDVQMEGWGSSYGKGRGRGRRGEYLIRFLFCSCLFLICYLFCSCSFLICFQLIFLFFTIIYDSISHNILNYQAPFFVKKLTIALTISFRFLLTRRCIHPSILSRPSLQDNLH